VCCTHTLTTLRPCPLSSAAFYCDCEHAIGKVTKGHRLCLVFNLVWKGSGPAPALAAKDDGAALAKAIEAIRAWESDAKGPPRLIHILQHEYTTRVRGIKAQSTPIKPSCLYVGVASSFVLTSSFAPVNGRALRLIR
jgi:hypothetical protein